MLIGNKEYTIGADPEVWLGHGGKFVSAHDKLPGDKETPYQVECGAVQVDGMAAEFNTNPAKNFEEFNHNLSTVQSILLSMVPGLEFLQDTTVEFDEDFLKTIPSINKELGCSADYDGWSMKEIDSPDSSLNMRTVGGHIHIGGFSPEEDPFEWDHYESCCRLARMMDETIGVYSVLWDKDNKRRKMYGKAGSFRPKIYGMEYRPLSNKWIFNKNLIRFVYDGAVEAVQRTFYEDRDANPVVQEIINNGDNQNNYFKGDIKAEMLKDYLNEH